MTLNLPESPGARRVLAAVAADGERLAAAVTEELRSQVPTYARVFTDAGLMAASTAAVAMLRSLSESGRMGPGIQEQLAAAGVRRAHDGVPLEDMLRGWHLAIRVVVQHTRRVAVEIGAPATDTVDAVDIILDLTDAAMRVAARAHRQAELDMVQTSAEHRAAAVSALLTGKPHASARTHASALGLDPSRQYVAVRIKCPDPVQLETLVRTVTDRPEQRGAAGAGTAIDGHLGAILAHPPGAVPGTVIGVGPLRYADRLHESFALATRVLQTADALGLDGTHSFESLALECAVASDAAVGFSMYRRYVEPLGDSPGALEIQGTVTTYLETGLNVDRTAERLSVHPNTVRYRLARFEELADVRLRDPKVLFGVWWALTERSISRHRSP